MGIKKAAGTPVCFYQTEITLIHISFSKMPFYLYYRYRCSLYLAALRANGDDRHLEPGECRCRGRTGYHFYICVLAIRFSRVNIILVS